MTSSSLNTKSQSEIWGGLAAKSQAGDKIAYAELLKAIVPYIKNLLAGRLANSDWIDDITQEVLLSVHKSLHTYDPEKPFQPWLSAIVSFRRTDYLRAHYRHRKHQEVSSDILDFQGERVTNPSHAGELKDIEGALQTLPEKQRKVFKMLKVLGYSVEDVAKEMDMSESAVKVSAHRAMKILQKKLG